MGFRGVTPGIGRVVEAAKIDATGPMYGGQDIPALERYVGAIENPEQGPTPVKWESFDEFDLQARVSDGQAVLLQETYDPARHAYEGSTPLRVRLDPVMNFHAHRSAGRQSSNPDAFRDARGGNRIRSTPVCDWTLGDRRTDLAKKRVNIAFSVFRLPGTGTEPPFFDRRCRDQWYLVRRWPRLIWGRELLPMAKRKAAAESKKRTARGAVADKRRPSRPAALHARSEEPVAPDPEDSPRADFPIVGVGASAGGLEALSEFLKALPARTGIAVVVVQHLAPQHESALTQILSKANTMPVLEASDGMAVQRNHIFM